MPDAWDAEVKFLVDHDTAVRIGAWASSVLDPDPSLPGLCASACETTTVYFDTADLAAYHRRGSYGRAKYRLRRYGENATVLLERKVRSSRGNRLRQTPVAIGELASLEREAPSADWPGRWFHRRLLLRRLVPICRVQYRRFAWVGRNGGGVLGLRVDEGLKVAATARPQFEAGNSDCALGVDAIIEVSFRGSAPSVFKRLVEEFALEPVRFSKYRLAVECLRPTGPGVAPNPRRDHV